MMLFFPPGMNQKTNSTTKPSVVRRDPSSRHSMLVLGHESILDRQFVDAVRGSDPVSTSRHNSGSVDHLLFADSAVLGSGSLTPGMETELTKPATSFWKPLFKHTTMTSAAPLLMTLKRDTHVQTEVPVSSRLDLKTIGVQTEVLPTHTSDVLVQTSDEWVVQQLASLLADRLREGSAKNRSCLCTPDASKDVAIVELEGELRKEVNENTVNVSSGTASCEGESGKEVVGNSDSKNASSALPDCSIYCQTGKSVPEEELSQEKDYTTTEIHSPRSVVKEGVTKKTSSLTCHETNSPTMKYTNLSIHKEEEMESREQDVTMEMPLASAVRDNDSEKDKSGRCSSCSTSTRMSLVSELDVLYTDSIKFDSCENLDQLEEEIIRSLYSPLKEMEQDMKDSEQCLNKDRRGKIIPTSAEEKPRRGGCSPSQEGHTRAGLPEDGDVSVEVLPCRPVTAPCVLEVRRSSWSATGRSCQTPERNARDGRQGIETLMNDVQFDPIHKGRDDSQQTSEVRQKIFEGCLQPLREMRSSSYERLQSSPSMLRQGERSDRMQSPPSVFRQSERSDRLQSPPSVFRQAERSDRLQSPPSMLRQSEMSDRLQSPPSMLRQSEMSDRLQSPPAILQQGEESDRLQSPPAILRQGERSDRLRSPPSKLREGELSDRFQSSPAAMLQQGEESDRLQSPTTMQRNDRSVPSHPSPEHFSEKASCDSIPIALTSEICKEEEGFEPEVKMKSEIHINLKMPNERNKDGASPNPPSISEPVSMGAPPPPPPPPPPPSFQGAWNENKAPKNQDSLPLDSLIHQQRLNSQSPYPNDSSKNIGREMTSPRSLMLQELSERFQRLNKDEEENDEQSNVESSSLPNSDITNAKSLARENAETSESKRNVTVSSHPNSFPHDATPPTGNAPSHFRPVFKAAGPKTVWQPNREEDPYATKPNHVDITGRSQDSNIQNGNWSNQNSFVPESQSAHEADQWPPPPPLPSYNVSSSIPSTVKEPNSYVNRTEYEQSSVPMPGRTIVTDEPPPAGAILVDQKVTVEGDKIHTDKYYAVPVKEVLKEKTTTTKFIPAPPKYEGIGPTEEGMPTGLRQSVKKENMSNWYKSMFKSLHKADDYEGQRHYYGYSSDPEIEREDKNNSLKSATLGNRQRHDNSNNRNNNLKSRQDYPPSVKSTIVVYNVHPRSIEDYEPGQSSVVDNEITVGTKRFLPSMNHPKPSYEFKDGYESDTTMMKKSNHSESPDLEQQKAWYREVQRGGEIPKFGLNKPAPEKPQDPVVGPPPSPPPQNYPKELQPQKASRPLTLPPEDFKPSENHISEPQNENYSVQNGNYSVQMRQAIHAELQQRMLPPSQQLSPNARTLQKSPSKSPEMKMIARVLYNFAAETPRELSLKKGDMVLIFKQLDKNWYEGELKGTVGIFPVSYVEILPPEHVTPHLKLPQEGLAKAKYNFQVQTSVELPLKKGDTVTLMRRVDENWYEGRIGEKKGIFPASYIQVLQEPGETSPNLQSPKSASSPQRLGVKEEKLQISPVSSSHSPVQTSPHSMSSEAISKKVPQPSRMESNSRSKKGSSLIEPVLYRALYGYNPQNADELELLDGDTVYVVEMCDDGWYVGTSVRTGVFGIFPGNYVEKV